MAVKRIALIGFLFLIPALAKADNVEVVDTFWDYTGVVMDGNAHGHGSNGPACNCILTGSIEFGVNAAGFYNGSIDAFSFTDGNATLNNLNATLQPGSGIEHFDNNAISAWLFIVNANNGQVQFVTEADGAAGESDDSVSYGGKVVGFEDGLQGVWTEEAVATPEPSTSLFLAVGLAALALAIRFRRTLSLTYFSAANTPAVAE